MRKQLYRLRDAVWRRLEALVPPEPPGAHRVGDRRVISGIEPRWRDCPPEYRPYTTIYNLFNR
jgi:transposase